MAGNTNFNTNVLSSTTRKFVNSEFADNIFNSHLLLQRLKEKAYVEVDGGERLLEPLLYKINTDATSYSGYDVLSTTPTSPFTAAEFEWKQYSAPITISGREERINQGKSSIVNLLMGKIKEAEMSIAQNMTTDLFGDGTANGGKALDGLSIMVDSAGTYGNINRATAGNEFWQANETAQGGALTISAMATKYTQCSRGGQNGPDLIIMTSTLFDKYEALMQANQRFGVSNTKLADAGFMTLKFRGADVMYDEQCTSGVIYFLNTDHLKLRYHRDANFSMRDFQKPDNQDSKIAHILWMGNLTANNCRYLGKLTGATA